MQNSCKDFSKYNVVSEYGKFRYQDMRRHKGEPHVIIEREGSKVHNEMSKNCKILIESYGETMAPKLSKQAMAYHIF